MHISDLKLDKITQERENAKYFKRNPVLELLPFGGVILRQQREVEPGAYKAYNS